MAFLDRTLRAVIFCAAASFVCSDSLLAQQFADPAFRSYGLKSARPSVIEDSLRRFLDDRVSAGETIEIVSDNRAQRILVNGSDEVQTLAKQFIAALDLPSMPNAASNQVGVQPAQAPVGQAAAQVSNVRGYFAGSIKELQQKEAVLRQIYAGRDDIRIGSDARTRQLVVHAAPAIHQQINANWNNPAFFMPMQSQPQQAVGNAVGYNTQTQLQLENTSWQDLLKSLRGVQGPNAVVTAPSDGTLAVQVAGNDGNQTQFLIDQQKQLVQITGPAAATQQWSRVVKALDNEPGEDGETRATGRLGSAQPATITRTITMLGANAGSNSQQLARPFNATRANQLQRLNQSGGLSQEQTMLAQANGAQPGQAVGQGTVQRGGDGEVARMLMEGDASGSFLGPVVIEFIEGTDIFIVRGQQRDVDRVMKLINDIERLTQETEPAIDVVPLQHANSSALAELINQLNEGTLQARQGDVSVTPLVKPNSILLIGRPNGVESVKKIIQKLDVEAEASDQFKVFKLDHLPSVDAETTINNLYNVTQQGANTTDTVATLGPRVRAIADYRSNSVVVQASPRDLQEIEDLLDKIDVESSATVSEVRVFRLKNAIAEEVSDVLKDTLQTRDSQQAQSNIGQQGGFGGAGAGGQVNTQATSSPQSMTLEMKVLDAQADKLLDNELLSSGILSNVIVTSNERSNAVVVTAPKGSMELIAEIVRQLDELPAQEAEIRVFNIVNGDAALLIEMLDTLFEQDQNTQGPLIQSAAGTGESTLVPLRFALDQRTNSIIASGNGADLRVVEAILLKLDSSDVSRRRSAVVELQIQEALQVANAITDFVQQRRQAVLGIAQDTISQYELLDQEVVVVAEEASNKLIVNATDRYFDDIMEIIRELDRRPDMVMVQVMIAEVTLNSTEEMGVELGIQDSLLFNRSNIVDGVLNPGFAFNNQALGTNATNPGSARDQVAGQALSDLGLARQNSELGFGGLVLSASNESVSVLVRALQEARRLDVLSRPQIMMLNNTTAEVQVGSDVPYVTGTNAVLGTVTNSIDFRQVGLLLNVTPRISPDGLIALQVVAQRSNLGAIEDGIPVSAANGVVIRAPIFNVTRTETFVTARDGQTVILGGLIQKNRSAFERKVPYLGDIPFLGRLFRSDGISEERTELIVVLTPQIVRDDADIDRVNSEEYARMSWCLGDVIEMHGDIGPGRRYYRDDVYTEIGAGGQVVSEEVVGESMDSGYSSGQGQPTYALPEPVESTPGSNFYGPTPHAIESAPSSQTPPMPTLPEAPQASRPSPKSVLTKSASLFPFSKKGLWKGTPSKKSTQQQPAAARLVQREPRRPAAQLPAKGSESLTRRVGKRPIQAVQFQSDAAKKVGEDVRSLGTSVIEPKKPVERLIFRFDEVPGE